MMDKRQCGFTLTSIMVAVGLSGVLAVAGVRLVVNQMNALRVMELIDKGDAIYKFYSNLLHDDKVWWCTLYDGMEGSATVPPNPNKALRECVFGKGGCGSSMPMMLKGPDCKFDKPPGRQRFKQSGALDFDPGGNFRSSNVPLIPDVGKDLKESVMKADSGGWWNVDLKWTDVGNNAVDLIFEQKFDADKWRSAPTAGKRYMPELNYPRTFRIRRSTNYLSGSGCGAAAVTEIGLHTASRNVVCGASLVNTVGNLDKCPKLAPLGQVVHSTTACSGPRVSVTPTNCGRENSVIWKIGDGTSEQNVICALDGRGKMVNYGGCSGSYDTCTASIRIYNDKHMAIKQITNTGGISCTTLMGWPSTSQGPIGSPGPNTPGPPGPAAQSC